VLGWGADEQLLRSAGATVQRLGGCCGLAGNFGVEKGHYEVSVAVADQQLRPAVAAAPIDTEILADGFSCRTQLADLTDRRAGTWPSCWPTSCDFGAFAVADRRLLHRNRVDHPGRQQRGP
jgi:Fe-S oxidoreductase